MVLLHISRRVSWCPSTSHNEVRVEVSNKLEILALRAQTTYQFLSILRRL